MSRPVTRNFTKKQNLDPEPHVSSSTQKEKPATSTPIQDKTLVPSNSRASTVSHNKSRSSRTSRSRVQEWLCTEFLTNEQHEPAEYARMRCWWSYSECQTRGDLPKHKVPNDQRVCPDPKLSDVQQSTRVIKNLLRPSEPKEMPYYNGNVSQPWNYASASQS